MNLCNWYKDALKGRLFTQTTVILTIDKELNLSLRHCCGLALIGQDLFRITFLLSFARMGVTERLKDHTHCYDGWGLVVKDQTSGHLKVGYSRILVSTETGPKLSLTA